MLQKLCCQKTVWSFSVLNVFLVENFNLKSMSNAVLVLNLTLAEKDSSCVAWCTIIFCQQRDHNICIKSSIFKLKFLKDSTTGVYEGIIIWNSSLKKFTACTLKIM